jgi:proteasome lid subunit RPN8/RPN11
VEALRLLLPASTLAELVRRSRAEEPAEACGLLVGERLRRGAWHRVTSAPQGANLAAAEWPPSFDIDPVDVARIGRRAAREGRVLLGTWHSHPGRPARPSAADRAGAVEGWSHLVLGAPEGRGSGPARSWRLVAGELREERLLTRPLFVPSS